MGYEISEIKSVSAPGSKRFEYVEPLQHMYLIQRDNWRYKYKIKLPHWSTLLQFGKPGSLRILCKRLYVTINFKNTYWMQFNFKPGFVTDLASVPWYFRSIVDNDDRRVLTAALVHDFLFSTHRLPFKLTNRLFRKMLMASGYGRFRSWLAYIAVSSFVGRRHWRETDAKIDREIWASDTVEMRLPRPVQYDGRNWE